LAIDAAMITTSPRPVRMVPRFTTPAFESPANVSAPPDMKASLEVLSVEPTNAAVSMAPLGPTTMPCGLIK
jgi:hypothetical protein